MIYNVQKHVMKPTPKVHGSEWRDEEEFAKITVKRAVGCERVLDWMYTENKQK